MNSLKNILILIIIIVCSNYALAQTEVWKKSYDQFNTPDIISEILQDGNNFYVISKINEYSDSYPNSTQALISIFKIDGTGNKIWRKSFHPAIENSSQSYEISTAKLINNQIKLTGYFSNVGYRYFFILIVDKNGNQVLYKKIGPVGTYKYYDACVLEDSTILFTYSNADLLNKYIYIQNYNRTGELIKADSIVSPKYTNLLLLNNKVITINDIVISSKQIEFTFTKYNSNLVLEQKLIDTSDFYCSPNSYVPRIRRYNQLNDSTVIIEGNYLPIYNNPTSNNIESDTYEVVYNTKNGVVFLNSFAKSDSSSFGVPFRQLKTIVDKNDIYFFSRITKDSTVNTYRLNYFNNNNLVWVKYFDDSNWVRDNQVIPINFFKIGDNLLTINHLVGPHLLFKLFALDGNEISQWLDTLDFPNYTANIKMAFYSKKDIYLFGESINSDRTDEDYFIKKIHLDFMGIENIKNKKVVIYPNPSSNNITISGFCEKYFVVEIFDLLGNKKIHLENHSAIDVSTLTKGLYIIRIEGKKEVFTTKFLKN